MKKYRFLIAALVLIALVTAIYAASSANYKEQGGARTVIGGSLDVVSGGEIDIESGGAWKIAGTAVTASAAELNAGTATGVTPGTVAASKTVVVDASKDIGIFRHITIAGNLVGEGTADDSNQITIAFATPTAARTITMPDSTGTVMLAGANSEIFSVVVDVNSAEILDLAANPKELIASPGSGKMLKLISCMLWLNKGGTAYDDASADGNMLIMYVDGSGLAATGSIEGDAFIDATADFIIAVEPVALAATAVTSVENDALVLDNDGAEYTTGDGTLKVFLTYAVITTGL